MTHSANHYRAICAALIGAAVLLTASSANARHTTITGPNGGVYGRSVNHYNNGGGNLGRTVSATRPNGQTATKSFNRSVSNGTITDTKTVTGFNGKTGTATMTRTPGEGGTITGTGPNGGTYNSTFGPN